MSTSHIGLQLLQHLQHAQPASTDTCTCTCTYVLLYLHQIPRWLALPDRPLTSFDGCCRSSMPCVKACCTPSATIWTASSALMLMTWMHWILVSCTSQMLRRPPPHLRTRPACSLLTSATPCLTFCPEFCTIGSCDAILLQSLLLAYCTFTRCLTFCPELCTMGSCNALLPLHLLLGHCTFTRCVFTFQTRCCTQMLACLLMP